MRVFLGIVIAILGIGAIGTTLLGFGSQTLFWQVAHYVAGAALILGGISLVRSEQTVVNDIATPYDNTDNFTPPPTR